MARTKRAHLEWVIGIVIIGFLVGLVARWIGPGPHFYGFWVTAAIGIAGSVLATFGGQALGLYRIGQPAGFIGSVVGAIVLLVLSVWRGAVTTIAQALGV